MSPFEDLLRRIEREGPVRLTVTEEEYERLRRHAKALWEGDQRWFSYTRLLFLAFLRGYTFYRELPENEDQFWASLLGELEVNHQGVTMHQYDELEAALKQHPEVRQHFRVSQGPQRRRREFVLTIFAVWGRGLRVAELIEWVIEYYTCHHPGEDFLAMLKRRHPDMGEDASRVLYPYGPVFTALAPVIGYVLERRLPVADIERLIRSLEQAGFDLGRPNCVRFLANKSAHVLPEIVRRLSGLPKARRPLVRRERERLAARRELRRGDVRLRLLELSGTALTEHDLQWRIGGQMLLEGQTQSGYLRLPDGRFSTFTWKPLRAPDGSPGKVRLAVGVDEVQAVVELESQPMAVRWLADGKPLLEARPTRLDGLGVQLLTPYRRREGWNLRYSVASEPNHFADRPDCLRPLADDTLLAEVCLNRRTNLWLPLSRLPLEVTPEIVSLEVKGGVCRVAVKGPREVILTLTETDPVSGQQVVRAWPIRPEGIKPIRMVHPQRLRPINIRVTLEASGLITEKSVVAPPTLSLEGALRSGLGWSPAR